MGEKPMTDPMELVGRLENIATGSFPYVASAAAEAERQRDELRKALERAADDLRDIGGQSPRPSNSPDPEHENYLRRVLISLAQVGNTRARQALANQGAAPTPVKKERAWICPQDNTPCPPECDSDDRRHCASVACNEQPE